MQNITNKKIYKAIAIAHSAMYKGIIVVAFGILAMFVLYVYFIVSAIFATVGYKEARANIASVHSELATQEAVYLAKKNELTKDLALESGLGDLNNKKYITRTVVVGRAN